MSWRVRCWQSDGVPDEDVTPDYGSKTEYFSIKLHYSGRFEREPKLKYVDGKVCYIDYCCTDEISKIEIGSMLVALGVAGKCNCYYSCTGFDDCDILEPIICDKDALVLGMFCDDCSCRMVGVFVDHHMLPFQDIAYPVVNENLGDDDVDVHVTGGNGLEKGEWCNMAGEGCTKATEVGGEPSNAGEGGSNAGEGCSKDWEYNWDGLEDMVEFESGDSDGAVSVGDDSEHSEYIGDSEGNYDIDNKDYEAYVDHEEEWAGLDEPNGRKEWAEIPDIPDIGEEGEIPSNVFQKREENKPIDLELGMCFTDADDFRRTVRQHAIKMGRDLTFPINSKFKVQAKCKNEKCKWLVYASRVKADDTFRIKTIHDKHRCPRLNKVVHATSKYLAEKYMRKLKSDPKWPVDSMLEILQDENKVSFSRWQIYRCKNKVAKVGAGYVADQYKQLWSYGEEIMKSNPGSTVRIKCKDLGEGQAMFKRFYVCWAALKRGLLEGCRKVICFDGCHLKTGQGGVLLSAVGIDANNGIYPFAYAVVEKEKKSSWVWFLDLIARDLDIQNSHLWTLMSDKQKGLIEAVNEILPDSEHRFCVMHLYSNFKLTYRGLALKDMLWRAARATRVVDFNRTMQAMKDRNVQAFEWLQKRDPKHWSRSHFSCRNKTDLMYNNLSESFNSTILHARAKPIIKMLEEIRLILMLRIGLKKKEMLKHTGLLLCPNIEGILDANKEKAHSFKAIWNGHDEFNVDYSSTVSYKVHLGVQSCNCRRWQLTGIPCAHAISCMYYMGYNPEDFVADCYKTDTYLKVYSHSMHPLTSQEEWPLPTTARSEIIPPKANKLPGRPKKFKRKLQPDEKKSSQTGSQNPSQSTRGSQRASKKANPKKFGSLGRKGLVITCRTCGIGGHNSRTCGKKKEENHEIPARNPEKVAKGNRKRKGADANTPDGNHEAPTKGRAACGIKIREPEAEQQYGNIGVSHTIEDMKRKGKEKMEEGKHQKEKGAVKKAYKRQQIQIGRFNPLKFSPRKRSSNRSTMSQPMPSAKQPGSGDAIWSVPTLTQPNGARFRLQKLECVRAIHIPPSEEGPPNCSQQ